MGRRRDGLALHGPAAAPRPGFGFPSPSGAGGMELLAVVIGLCSARDAEEAL